jgi:hypothetical protein
MKEDERTCLRCDPGLGHNAPTQPPPTYAHLDCHVVVSPAQAQERLDMGVPCEHLPDEVEALSAMTDERLRGLVEQVKDSMNRLHVHKLTITRDRDGWEIRLMAEMWHSL